MKAFINRNPRDLKDAVAILGETRDKGRTSAIVGGGSDLLGMVKERLIQPDVLVNLKAMRGMDQVTAKSGELEIGGLITLNAVSRHNLIRKQYQALAEAAENVGTPQIRNVGTLAGNVCQRPWCWYLRNGFACFKNGGQTCFSATGENQLHAIFGGGPSYIVHPSDTAPALVALDAKFRVAGPSGERVVPASDFFILPRVDFKRENVLNEDELLVAVHLPAPGPATRSTYHKVLDREAWTHAVISVAIVLEMEQQVCRGARVVLGGVAPIPWRLPKVEGLLTGQHITAELATAAGDAAVEGARPLSKNGYKVGLTRAVVKRTLLSLGSPA